MVLKHHPDKRKAAGEQIGEGDNDYFTCITKGKQLISFIRYSLNLLDYLKCICSALLDF